jgi:hypothetical protein
MLIKLSNTLEVEMWEMFDFGHVKSHKELRESLQSLIKTADEPTLRLALKVIRAVNREARYYCKIYLTACDKIKMRQI